MVPGAFQDGAHLENKHNLRVAPSLPGFPYPYIPINISYDNIILRFGTQPPKKIETCATKTTPEEPRASAIMGAQWSNPIKFYMCQKSTGGGFHPENSRRFVAGTFQVLSSVLHCKARGAGRSIDK